MSSKRKEYKVTITLRRPHASLLHAIKANAATRLSIPAAMRAKGFKCQDHGSNFCPVENTSRAETGVAAAAMLALSNMTKAVRCCMQD
jgi:hypothetical protein